MQLSLNELNNIEDTHTHMYIYMCVCVCVCVNDAMTFSMMEFSIMTLNIIDLNVALRIKDTQHYDNRHEQYTQSYCYAE